MVSTSKAKKATKKIQKEEQSVEKSSTRSARAVGLKRYSETSPENLVSLSRSFSFGGISAIRNKLSKIRLSGAKIGLGLGIAALLAFLYFGRSLFVAAVVNNTIITRFSLDQELEKRGGKQVLENKIVEALILQEAKKQNIKISSEEVNQKVADIENLYKNQNENLDSLLSASGMTRNELENQIRLNLTIEKILSKDLTVSDQEVSDYFNKNKNYYPKGTTLADKTEEIKATLTQNKLSDRYQSWINEQKNNSRILYFLNF
jgi:hypothetical protein